MDELKKRYLNHYESCFLKNGACYSGVDWGSSESADLRHKLMLQLYSCDWFKPQGEATILDVGCGYARFYEYIKEQKLCTLEKWALLPCDPPEGNFSW